MTDLKRASQDVVTEHLKFWKVENYPTFLAVTSWFALHNSDTEEEMSKVINPADHVQDYNCDSDGQRLFGFVGDAQGCEALNTLRGLIDCDVFIHDGQGNYIGADDVFLKEIGLNAKTINVSDTEVLQAFISNFMQKNQQQKYPVIKLS